MNDKTDLKDRMMDELLREDARGEAADEKLLDAVEAAIDGEVEDGKVTPIAERRSRAPYAWAALLTVSAASVLGYVGWKASQRGEGDLASVAMERGIGIEAPGAGDIAGREEILPGIDVAGGTSYTLEGLGKDDVVWTDPDSSAVPGASLAQDIASQTPSPGEPTVVPDAQPMPDPLDVAPIAREEAARVPVRSVVPRPTPLPAKPMTGRAQSENEALTLRKRNSKSKESDAAPRGYGNEGAFGDEFRRDAPPTSRENYGQLIEQQWKTPVKAKFSTFSVDVDTASYTNIRRMLQQGARVPADAVRIEECVNYFDYRYAPPTKGGPFAVHVDMATCPWAPGHHLMKVGLKGMEVNGDERPTSNLVFLIDVSGSMQGTAKLPLLVESMKVLVEELDDRDRVGIVVYAGSEGVVLNPTQISEDGRGAVLAALNKLRSGGSTNGGAGIKRAYAMAREQFIEGGVNRVILATDGDFNVGTTSQGELVKLVQEQAKSGVYLSVLAFGSGNINDAMLEQITNDGNGNYFYIDSQKEGRKVFLQDLSGTLVTIAKDVKIQVDFNPGKVQAYRLIGYANRILRDRDFNDDKIDAGDIGAGHTVTALYEIVPHGAPMPAVGGVDASKYDRPAAVPKPVDSDEWLTVKLRYKAPDGDKSTLLEVPVSGDPVAWEGATDDFRFASSVALFGMKLRDSEHANDAGWDLVRELAKKGLGVDVHGYRAEFLTLVDKAAGMAPVRRDPQPGVEAPAAR